MARLTVIQRAERSLHLIMGMRLPRVQELIEPFGFTPDVITEGWALMAELTNPDATLSRRQPFDPGRYTDHLLMWLPISRAALSAEYHQERDLLFHGLHSTRIQHGRVALIVFAHRLEAMTQGEAPFGSRGVQARNVLVLHGLTQEIEAEMLALQSERPTNKVEEHLVRSVEHDEQAADQLWVWYLKWSLICRTAIKNKTLLRSLGFEPATNSARRDDQRTTHVRLVHPVLATPVPAPQLKAGPSESET